MRLVVYAHSDLGPRSGGACIAHFVNTKTLRALRCFIRLLALVLHKITSVLLAEPETCDEADNDSSD